MHFDHTTCMPIFVTGKIIEFYVQFVKFNKSKHFRGTSAEERTPDARKGTVWKPDNRR